MGFKAPVALARPFVIRPQFLGNVGFDLDDTYVGVPLLEIIRPCVRPIQSRYVNLGENQDNFTVRELVKIGGQ